MNLVLTILLILGFSYLLRLFSKKTKIPYVVILIVFGLILSIPPLKSQILEPDSAILFLLGDVGFVALMFLTGLETSKKWINKEKVHAFTVVISATIISVSLGTLVFKFIGFSWTVSFLASVIMNISSEATRIKLLYDLKKLKTEIGSLLVDTGILDDFLRWAFFIYITFLARQPPYLEVDFLITSAVIAFFIGVYIKHKTSIEKVEKPISLTIIPFFFVTVGLTFDITTFTVNPLLLGLVIIIAILGKVFGALATKPLTHFSWERLFLIGWALNSRAASGIALALIAFKTHLIGKELYSSLVLMALVTTLITPFVIKYLLKKHPGIMGQTS